MATGFHPDNRYESRREGEHQNRRSEVLSGHCLHRLFAAVTRDGSPSAMAGCLNEHPTASSMPTLPNGRTHRSWQVFAWWPRHFRVVSPRDSPNHRSQPVLPSELNRLRYRAGAVLLLGC